MKNFIRRGEFNSKYCSRRSLLIHKIAKRKRSRGAEILSRLWWQHGYHNWTNEQSKRRLRVNCDTFNFILNAIEDFITKEVTKFKEPLSPDLQLG